MGVDVGDVNGDGLFDIFVTNFSDDYNTLYLNQGGLRFVDASDVANLVVSSLPYLGWSTRLADLDADGDLDIFVVNATQRPGRHWRELSAAVQVFRTAATAPSRRE
jgi:hypothetical protein